MANRFALLGLLVLVAACDSDPEPSSVIDADTAEQQDQQDQQDQQELVEGDCTYNGLTMVEQVAYSDTGAFVGTAANGDALWIDGSTISEAGTITLGATAEEQNPETCSVCVFLDSECGAFSCEKTFFATSGSLTISSLASSGRFTGALSGVKLAEVAYDDEAMGYVLVPNGESWCLASLALDAPAELAWCNSSADCAGNQKAKLCDELYGECVQCLADTDCSGGFCDFYGVCQAPCTSNADCGGWAPVCDTGTGQCLECVTDTDCGGDKCSEGYCESTCKSDSDCDAWAPHCDTGTGQCYECSTNADCDDWAPLCDTTAQECVECLSANDCGGDPCSDGYCEFTCKSDADCDEWMPHCDTATGQCYECKSDGDCGTEAPLCDTTWLSCVECIEDSDCPSGTCFIGMCS